MIDLTPAQIKQALRLYLVTDDALCLHHSLLDVVQLAVQSGVTCVQLREKHLATGAFVEKARALQAIIRRHAPHVPLIINDRVDVALAVGADGVHVGQSDMVVADVRRLMAVGVVGLSVESMDDVTEVEKMRSQGIQIDYLGISPVFGTMTKSDIAPPLGLEGVAKIRALTDLPLVGIGGIHVGNAHQVIQAGADGIAVVSAICSAAYPDEAVRALLETLRSNPCRI
ncbi:MAG: thiamine phosphate synthase [Burkholderiales bacterium]|nr:thiamine phosphate synthase [Burkholderiales bacterium]MCE1177221.1 thiamine phosphate synthase [Burkholderiales bacterium]